ncbi:MAG: hypothetical protein WDW36_005173 [Sanguina aurantia]
MAASLSRQPAEVDWESLDKTKFFYTGALMFSGVTTMLFPLSVLKTRQMALPGVQGVRQMAVGVWKADGVRGFYRGFGTVMLGTIPGRSVYLSTLEYVKSSVHAVGSEHLSLSQPVLAGASNFIAGAVASLTTQCVTVPIDIVSQRQMVHGSQTHAQPSRPHTSSTHSASASASSAHTSSPTAPVYGQQPQPTASHPAASTPKLSPVHSSSSSTAAAGHGAPVLHQAASGHPPPPVSNVAASLSAQEPPKASSASRAPFSTSSHVNSSSTPQVHPPTGSSSSGGGGGGGSGGSTRVSGLHIARDILKTEGMRAVWWGAYGAYQKLLWTVYDDSSAMFTVSAAAPASTAAATPLPTGREIVVVQTLASILAGSTSTLITNPLDLIKTRIQVATKVHGQPNVTISSVLRQILREDGARGLLRGVLPRMVNASMWGTAMVSVYEYLKRVCRKTEEDGSPYVGA